MQTGHLLNGHKYFTGKKLTSDDHPNKISCRPLKKNSSNSGQSWTFQGISYLFPGQVIEKIKGIFGKKKKKKHFQDNQGHYETLKSAASLKQKFHQNEHKWFY